MSGKGSTEGTGPAPIAIIGIACIFPQAPDLQAFWNNILRGVDAIGEPLASWDAERYLETGRIKTPHGGYLNDLYRFDPREFGIMPNSLDGCEPDQFLALRVARDALQDAGYLGAAHDHTSTGVILGHSTYLHRGQGTLIQNNIVLDQTIELLKAVMPQLDDAALEQIRQVLRKKLPPTNADTAPGLVPNVMTGRIANRLNLRGPNYLVDAACSSSLLAVSAAMDELRARRSRMMLAGGVNASLPADVSTIFTQLGALSVRGKVRPFEQGSDGTLLGEGLGVVVLKRLDDALADGDRIYAVLRSIGQASDGRGTGLLAPSVDGETLSIRRAYESTAIDPASIGLIEAHGTGIPLGDKTEIAALRNVFGERTAPRGTIALGSVKSMISHCIPAAGIAGLIKASLAIHHAVLPPTLCDEVNPELGIDRTPLFVNTESMPWIAPQGTPRRAGVNSFGFGGINAHAIIEQPPASALRPLRLDHLPFELCVFSADSVSALVASLERVQAALERQPEWRLDEIAAALAAADPRHPVRLAMVVKDLAALSKGLETALSRLREGKLGRWSTRTHVHFAGQPLDGKVGFLFPGEGSQYLNMFGDLALCFDEVRGWLDFWRGLYPDAPGRARTDIVFPPVTELTPELRRQLEARLHDMDVGSEAVMVGGQAMFALLTSLGVEAEAMLGHSSGESSALAACGALPAEPEALAHCIRQLNRDYQRVLHEGHIATGALLAVGALPAADVHRTLAESGAGVDVAMDNCSNQIVLYGSKAAIERIQAALTAIGGICMPLAFDRGYHTHAFQAVSDAFHEYYKRIRLGVPKSPLYSCSSTQLFPKTAAAVRKLAAAQWSGTVRFRETVMRMHDDGVRYFVEVGPSGNLTAFVGDILAEREHVALATNIRRKHGVEQLLSTLAQLYVGGRWAAVGRLFERRAVARIDFDQIAPARPGGVLLDNTMPVVRLDEADRQLLRCLVSPAPLPQAPEPAAVAATGVPAVASFAALPAQQVETALPFLDELVAQDGSSVHARSHLVLHRDQFLRDHVLSGRVSDTDPELLGLPCVPLMVSLEIMAEAAALLADNANICSIENVRAYDWIALDTGETLLDVRAEWIDHRDGLVRASLHQGPQTAVTATFRFIAAWRLPAAAPLRERRSARYSGREIYNAGMFHGPVFQTLGEFDGWDDSGIDVRLTPCSLHGFFEPGQPASLLLNPVLLDAMGQLAACWIVQYAGTDFNCFPSTIERIELYQPCPNDLPGLRMRGRQQPIDPAAARDVTAPRAWDFECVDAAGRPLVRVQRLVNVFFHVPNRFYRVRRDPLGGWLGQPLAVPERPDTLVWELEMLEEDFCGQSSAIFMRMLAHACLSFDERDEWYAQAGSVRQRRQWLLGRLCLKEAVRAWVHARTGVLLYPSDVIVLHDESGAPRVDGWWTETLVAPPALSLSHNDQWCLAAVRETNAPVGVDIETLGRDARPGLLAQSLMAREQVLVQDLAPEAREEMLLRLWCAKEAAAKLLGTGLQGAPERFEVTFVDDNQRTAWVRHQGDEIGVLLARHGESVIAVADRIRSGVGVS